MPAHDPDWATTIATLCAHKRHAAAAISIRQAMITHRLSQDDVAKVIGKSRSWVSTLLVKHAPIPPEARLRYLTEHAANGSAEAARCLATPEPLTDVPSTKRRRTPPVTDAENERVLELIAAATRRMLDPTYDPAERTPSGYEYDPDDEIPEGTVLQ